MTAALDLAPARKLPTGRPKPDLHLVPLDDARFRVGINFGNGLKAVFRQRLTSDRAVEAHGLLVEMVALKVDHPAWKDATVFVRAETPGEAV